MSSPDDQGIHAGDLFQEIESKGLLVHKKGEGQLDFQFTYLGFPFSVTAEAGSKGSSVRIHSDLGHLPYTSESLRARDGALRILAAASGVLGQRVRLTEEQRLEVNDSRTTKDPLTPVNLVTMMARILLDAKPYLKLLSEYLDVAPRGESSAETQ